MKTRLRARFFMPSLCGGLVSLRRFDGRISTISPSSSQEKSDGPELPGAGRDLRGADRRDGVRLRPLGEPEVMNGLLVLSACAAAGLFVYLAVALLWPEQFS
jgi:K+-transporting ATPase KdpF subunit